MVVAIAMLVVASLVVTPAVIVTTVPLLVAAAVVALVVGIASARIISNELAQTRREWAKNRAEQAKAYQRVMSDRTREQAEFAKDMTERVRDRDKKITELRGTLRVVESRVRDGDRRLKIEQRRGAELQDTVETLRAEQEEVAAEAMTLWDGADVPTIIDLLNWEQTAANLSEVDGRKQA